MVYVMSEELKFNISKLLEMKDLSAQEKGEFVKSVCLDDGISQREFARRHGLSHSTVQDWTSGRQMKKYYYDKQIKHNELNSLMDRLIFVLSSKDLVLDDKGKRLIKSLKSELEKVEVC